MHRPGIPLVTTLALALALGVACESPTAPGPTLDGVALTAIPDLPGRPFGVAVALGGQIFVTQQDLDRVTIVPAAGARDSATVGADPGDVVITPNGATAIVSTFIGGDLHFLSVATGDQTDLTDIGPNAYRLALSASGTQVFVTTTGGKVYAVNLANGEKADSVQLTGSLQGIARRADGRIAVSSSAGTITLLDPATLDILQSVSLAATAQDIVFSKNGNELFVADESTNRILVLNGSTLARKDTITFISGPSFRPFGMALSPDGRTLVVSSPLTGSVAVVGALNHRVGASVMFPGVPRRVAFSLDGSQAYIADEAGRLNVLR